MVRVHKSVRGRQVVLDDTLFLFEVLLGALHREYDQSKGGV